MVKYHSILTGLLMFKKSFALILVLSFFLTYSIAFAQEETAVEAEAPTYIEDTVFQAVINARDSVQINKNIIWQIDCPRLQVHAGLRLPARLPVFDHDIGINAAANVEFRPQAHEARGGGGDQVIEDPVGDVLVERTFIPVRPHIELERFQLHARAVGHIVERQHGEVRLSGNRAEAREFRYFHVDAEVASRGRIWESL